jgi:dTDP-4-amino-4,6-dideoxygalactose transaminase
MKPTPVTKPYLPPLDECIQYLKGIWQRNWLTKLGPLVEELEQKLQAYHQLPMVVNCVANGNLALQTTLSVFGVKELRSLRNHFKCC